MKIESRHHDARPEYGGGRTQVVDRSRKEKPLSYWLQRAAAVKDRQLREGRPMEQLMKQATQNKSLA